MQERFFTVSCIFMPEFGVFSNGYKYVTIVSHPEMQKNEVIVIRRILTCVISALLLAAGLMLPLRAEAASADWKAGIVTTSSGKLNVRSSPSAGSAVVTSLGKGSAVTLISKSGDWWQVTYANGKFGYCHASFITVTEGTAASVAVSSGTLNVRSGAGTGYGKVGSLAKGEAVIRLSTAGGWSRILYHGTKTGYVSAQYLSGSYAPISLNVPNFKQTDPRWADVKIGTSGKPFSQIGCATTAVAMMESYRTGRTIYPDAMAKELRYTPSGSLYWPEHFTVVTDGSGYLSAVHGRLKQGKPVLLGVKNSSGSQHWVVVTGYSGGSNLMPARFSINDPGSNTRTNLQQLLNVYPAFYKFFSY